MTIFGMVISYSWRPNFIRRDRSEPIRSAPRGSRQPLLSMQSSGLPSPARDFVFGWGPTISAFFSRRTGTVLCADDRLGDEAAPLGVGDPLVPVRLIGTRSGAVD